MKPSEHKPSQRMKTTTLGTHFGPYLIDSEDGRIVAVRGHPTDPNPSPIGDALREYRHHRVERPAVRRSWLAHGPRPAGGLRGREPFVEIDWETALDLVATELARVRTTHGNQSIFAGSYGWGSAGRFHMPRTQLHRFGNLFGGYTAQKGTYSSAAADAILPYVFGMSFSQAVAQQTAWSVIADHTELFVSFGGMRTSNTDVTYGGQGAHHTLDWLTKAAANGTKLISVSPLADDALQTSQACDGGAIGGAIDGAVVPTWLSIRPGTDVALMLALIHELVVTGRSDEDFLATYCEGWPILRSYVLGTTDRSGRHNSQPTPRDTTWAASITGINAAEIRALAHEMADKRTLVNVTLSVQRTDHGEQAYWAAAALACVLGQVGLAGCGLALSFFTAGNVGSGKVRKRIPGLPVPPRVAGLPTIGVTGLPPIGVARITEMLEGGGNTYDFDGRTGTFPDTRLVYWCGGNPFHHHQDLNRLRAAWQLPDTVIVHEPFWSPLAKHADIVLPATTPLERSDIMGAEELLVYHAAACDPVGEAQDDYWIFTQLAKRLGFGSQFSEDRTADEWVEALYEIFRAANADAPAYEDFQTAGHWRHSEVPDMGDTDQVFLSEFRADPEAAHLRTPSGRIELFSSQIAKLGYDDCGPHPAWIEPYERLGGAGNDKFGLHLVSNQPRKRLHSQYDFAAVSQAGKVSGREPVRLHPSAAAARGISDGDVVRVFNDRGACLAGAVLDDAVRSDVCQLSTGAWYDPDEDGTCRAGNPNVLTRDKGTSKLGQGPSPHTCLVEMEPLIGPAPAVQAYEQPEFVADPRSRSGPTTGFTTSKNQCPTQ